MSEQGKVVISMLLITAALLTGQTAFLLALLIVPFM